MSTNITVTRNTDKIAACNGCHKANYRFIQLLDPANVFAINVLADRETEARDLMERHITRFDSVDLPLWDLTLTFGVAGDRGVATFCGDCLRRVKHQIHDAMPA